VTPVEGADLRFSLSQALPVLAPTHVQVVFHEAGLACEPLLPPVERDETAVERRALAAGRPGSRRDDGPQDDEHEQRCRSDGEAKRTRAHAQSPPVGDPSSLPPVPSSEVPPSSDEDDWVVLVVVVFAGWEERRYFTTGRGRTYRTGAADAGVPGAEGL
jgi:hypothetical protein